MSNQPKQPETPAAGAQTPQRPPENEEQRIQQQRESALREQASTAAGEAEKAKARVTALEGDLERANARVVELETKNEQLTGQVAGLGAAVDRTGLPKLPVQLPPGAAQLLESVTIVAGVNKKRTDAKAGDVVFVDPNDATLAKLRKTIGLVTTVHSVGQEQAKELKKSNFIVDDD